MPPKNRKSNKNRDLKKEKKEDDIFNDYGIFPDENNEYKDEDESWRNYA